MHTSIYTHIHTYVDTYTEAVVQRCIHTQARIQRLKEVSQTDSFITCIALSTLVRWLGAHHCKIS